MPEDPAQPRSNAPLVARLRAWGTLVTPVGALSTAVLAVMKPQDQTVTKAAYQQLAQGIEKLNQGLTQEHEQVATLRGYIAAKEGQPLLVQAPQSAPADAGAPSPLPGLVPLRRPQGAAGKPTALVLTPIPVEGAATAAGPPPAAPAPAPFHPADFDTVLKNAK